MIPAGSVSARPRAGAGVADAGGAPVPDGWNPSAWRYGVSRPLEVACAPSTGARLRLVTPGGASAAHSTAFRHQPRADHHAGLEVLVQLCDRGDDHQTRREVRTPPVRDRTVVAPRHPGGAGLAGLAPPRSRPPEHTGLRRSSRPSFGLLPHAASAFRNPAFASESGHPGPAAASAPPGTAPPVLRSRKRVSRKTGRGVSSVGRAPGLASTPPRASLPLLRPVKRR